MKKKSKTKLLLREHQNERIGGAAPAFTLDLTKISFSSLSTYQRCPKQFWFRYIQGIKSPPAIALTEGSAHHTALEYNNLHKMAKGRDLKASVITDKFVEELRGLVEKDQVQYEEESEDAIIERGKIWHLDYMKDFAPGIEPESVEKEHKKEVVLNGRQVIFHAFTDVTVPKKVIDYKTASAFRFNMFMKREIDSDLQLTFYSWLEDKPEVEQICFVKGNIPKVVPLTSSRNKADITWGLKVAESIVDSVSKGAFPMCPPTTWNCSERFCGYWKLCRGKK